MNLVFGHDQTVIDWIEKRHGLIPLGPCAAIGVIDDEGVLRGAFITTWKTDTTAELHLFGKTSNDTWKAYFRWVFDRCHRLEVMTSKTNVHIKRAAPKFGFKFEGVSKDYYGPRRDALRFYMTASFCRWLRNEGSDEQPIQVS